MKKIFALLLATLMLLLPLVACDKTDDNPAETSTEASATTPATTEKDEPVIVQTKTEKFLSAKTDDLKKTLKSEDGKGFQVVFSSTAKDYDFVYDEDGWIVWDENDEALMIHYLVVQEITLTVQDKSLYLHEKKTSTALNDDGTKGETTVNEKDVLAYVDGHVYILDDSNQAIDLEIKPLPEKLKELLAPFTKAVEEGKNPAEDVQLPNIEKALKDLLGKFQLLDENDTSKGAKLEISPKDVVAILKGVKADLPTLQNLLDSSEESPLDSEEIRNAALEYVFSYLPEDVTLEEIEQLIFSFTGINIAPQEDYEEVDDSWEEDDWGDDYSGDEDDDQEPVAGDVDVTSLIKMFLANPSEALDTLIAELEEDIDNIADQKLTIQVSGDKLAVEVIPPEAEESTISFEIRALTSAPSFSVPEGAVKIEDVIARVLDMFRQFAQQ